MTIKTIKPQATLLILMISIVTHSFSCFAEEPKKTQAAKIILESLQVYSIPVDSKNIDLSAKPSDIIIPANKKILTSSYDSETQSKDNSILASEINRHFNTLRTSGGDFHSANRALIFSTCKIGSNYKGKSLSANERICLASVLRDSISYDLAEKVLSKKESIYDHLVDNKQPKNEIKNIIAFIDEGFTKFLEIKNFNDKKPKTKIYGEDLYLSLMVSAYDLLLNHSKESKSLRESIFYPNGSHLDSPILRSKYRLNFTFDPTNTKPEDIKLISEVYQAWSKDGIPRTLNGLYIARSESGIYKKRIPELKEFYRGVSEGLLEAYKNYTFYLDLAKASENSVQLVLFRRGSNKENAKNSIPNAQGSEVDIQWTDTARNLLKSDLNNIFEETIEKACTDTLNKARVCSYDGELASIKMFIINRWAYSFDLTSLKRRKGVAKSTTKLGVQQGPPVYLAYYWNDTLRYNTQEKAKKALELFETSIPEYDPSFTNKFVSVEFINPVFYMDKNNFVYLQTYGKNLKSDTPFDYFSYESLQKRHIDVETLTNWSGNQLYKHQVIEILKSLNHNPGEPLDHPDALHQIELMKAKVSEARLSILGLSNMVKDQVMEVFSNLNENIENGRNGKIFIERPSMIMGIYPRLSELQLIGPINQYHEEPHIVSRDISTVTVEVDIPKSLAGRMMTKLGKKIRLTITPNNDSSLCDPCSIYFSSKNGTKVTKINKEFLTDKTAELTGHIDKVFSNHQEFKLRIKINIDYSHLTGMSGSDPENLTKEQISALILTSMAPEVPISVSIVGEGF